MLSARVLLNRSQLLCKRQCLTGVSVGLSRCFSSTRMSLDVSPFLMPAMSPTMEKGGIVSWKFKENESFNAGDVLLEVETDKAQIDVEAQDDGKLAKIIRGDGSKDVLVGDVIAFTADPEDDLSTLKIPEVTESMKQVSSGSGKEDQKPAKSEEPAPLQRKEGKNVSESKTAKSSGDVLTTADASQTLLPSVVMALADNGISKEDALANIKASGANGRILKGDVLAYAGKIQQDSVVKVAEYVNRNQKLDLSNIERIVLEVNSEEGGDGQAQAQAQAQGQGQDSGKTGKLAKPAQVEPIRIQEEILLEVRRGVDFTRFERAVREYIDDIYQYTHEQPLENTMSERYDSLFEDLVTVDPRSARFDVEYSLLETTDGSEDIFDLLGPGEVKEGKQVYSLEVSVTVNDKYDDAVEKADRFMECLRQLQFDV